MADSTRKIEQVSTISQPAVSQPSENASKNRKARRSSSHGGDRPDDGTERQQRRSRASGEILELLISEFNKSSNPSSAVRKIIATKTGMTERSVRIWFQNRRAKQRKLEKLKKVKEEEQQKELGERLGGPSSMLPLEINEKYSLIDCRSLAVGQWQRIRSGSISKRSLVGIHNLSPRLLNKSMDTTDLLVILSKKDHELNYFFSGVFQNEKVLFRIFFPVANIVRTSFIDNQAQKSSGDSEKNMNISPHTQLQMELSAPPKFAVHFFRDPSTGRENANKWSICEDFSEGQQVGSAHIGENGTGIPHVLAGSIPHLQYLNTAILSYCQSASRQSFPGPSTEPQLFEAAPLSADQMQIDNGSSTAVTPISLGTMSVPPTEGIIGINGAAVSVPNTINMSDIAHVGSYQLDPYQTVNNIQMNGDSASGFSGSPSLPGMNNDLDPLSGVSTETPQDVSQLPLNSNDIDKQLDNIGNIQKMAPTSLDIFQSDSTQQTPVDNLLLGNESQILSTNSSDDLNAPVDPQHTNTKPLFSGGNQNKDSEIGSADFFMDDDGINSLNF